MFTPPGSVITFLLTEEVPSAPTSMGNCRFKFVCTQSPTAVKVRVAGVAWQGRVAAAATRRLMTPLVMRLPALTCNSTTAAHAGAAGRWHQVCGRRCAGQRGSCC
jgi:hypothetical protein